MLKKRQTKKKKDRQHAPNGATCAKPHVTETDPIPNLTVVSASPGSGIVTSQPGVTWSGLVVWSARGTLFATANLLYARSFLAPNPFCYRAFCFVQQLRATFYLLHWMLTHESVNKDIKGLSMNKDIKGLSILFSLIFSFKMSHMHFWKAGATAYTHVCPCHTHGGRWLEEVGLSPSSVPFCPDSIWATHTHTLQDQLPLDRGTPCWTQCNCFLLMGIRNGGPSAGFSYPD